MRLAAEPEASMALWPRILARLPVEPNVLIRLLGTKTTILRRIVPGFLLSHKNAALFLEKIVFSHLKLALLLAHREQTQHAHFIQFFSYFSPFPPLINMFIILHTVPSSVTAYAASLFGAITVVAF